MTFAIKRGDTGPSISRILRDGDGAAIDFTGAAVVFSMALHNGAAVITRAAATTTATAGQVVYDWQPGATDIIGLYVAEFEVTSADGSVESVPNDGNLLVSIVQDLG